MPRSETPPEPKPFDEPWQAQAFAMTVTLHQRGHFTWSEWADTLSTVLHAEQQADTPSNAEYYRCWLLALERLLLAKALTDAQTVSEVTDQWHSAARNTPHGQPILLDNA